MALSSTTILYIVELVIYLLLAPIIAYLTFRHGRHGALAFFYINAFTAVRIIADIINIVQRNQSTTNPSLAATILSSVGLSPLLLAFSGLIHEIHYFLTAHHYSNGQKLKRVRFWLWIAQLQIHTISITGMILVIIGSTGLLSAKSVSDFDTHETLRKVGSILLLLLVLGLAHYSIWMLLQCRKATSSNIRYCVLSLARWTVAAIPLIAVKIAYSVAYTFDYTNTSLSPVTGSFVVKLLLVVGAPMFAIFAMVIGTWKSKDIGGVKGVDVEKVPDHFVEQQRSSYDTSRLVGRK